MSYAVTKRFKNLILKSKYGQKMFLFERLDSLFALLIDVNLSIFKVFLQHFGIKLVVRVLNTGNPISLECLSTCLGAKSNNGPYLAKANMCPKA